MEPAEYAALERVEREHWFYRGKRDIFRSWLRVHAPATATTDVLLDVGAGTGLLAQEMQERFRAVACDASPTALRLLGPRVPRAVCGRAEALPLRAGVAAVVTALDVLEHVVADRDCLAELVRVTRPGGLIFVTVPAFSLLWSDWDRALGHRRRYSRRQLLDLVDERDAAVLRCSFLNVAAFLPMLIYRRLRSALGSGGRRLEDVVPGRLLNRALYGLYVPPACWGWFQPPFGAGLLMILRKRSDPPGAESPV